MDESFGPAAVAIHIGDLERLGALLQAPLVAAAGCNSRAVLRFLLDHGVDIDGQNLTTPLDEAIYWSNDDIAAFLLDRGARVRALSTAAGLGDVDMMGRFFDDVGALRANAGPIGSPFADTVPAHLANDAVSIVDHAFVMAVNNGTGPQPISCWTKVPG